MASQKLLRILEYESDHLFNAFEKASIQGMGTPSEVSDFREAHFNVLLRKFFPFPHRVTKGIISDSVGRDSDSIDTIIINPNHPYTIEVGEKFGMIMADGVDLALELKPDLSDIREVHRGLKQMQSVKILRRVKSPILIPRLQQQDVVDHSMQIPTFLFSLRTKKDPQKTIDEIIQYYRDNNVPKNEQVDYVIFLGQGILQNHSVLSSSPLKQSEKKITGFSYRKFEKTTLAASLFLMNSVYHATATIGTQIITHYLNDLGDFPATPLND